ncbi:MAG: TRAP transporter large permease subunit [Acidimicrobiia bacterium]|nr:MAG: TRAP transporter large permease subunit [Acidimicrobiia bacterium]
MGGWLAVIMFVLFLLLLLSGYPVAFSFAGTAVVFTVLGLVLGIIDSSFLRLLPNRWFGSMSDFTLLAIIFFVFMGAIFERSGLAEELLTTIAMILGRVPGGLGLTVIFVGTLLAAATGVVAATVIVMGLIALPVMLKHGYDHKLATGVIISSGTLAQLVPPSLVLVLLASVAGVSVGDLFLGALIPGLILSGLYALYAFIVAVVHPEKAPLMPPEEKTHEGWALTRKAMVAVVPPLFLIFAVLGSIFLGVASPTEAGAVGAFGAAFLAFVNRNLTWNVIKGSGQSTSDITALVLMILFSSTFFALVFDRLGGQKLVTSWLTGIPGGKWGFIIVSMIAIFILGINLEFIEITFIAMPIFIPAAIALNINLVWFLVLVAINLNMAFISPPVGFSLFYLQSVAPPEVKTGEIHRGALPFMALQGVALVIVTAFPGTVNWLVQLSRASG